MLLRLIETLGSEPLLEGFNMQAVKKQWFKALMKRVAEDAEFTKYVDKLPRAEAMPDPEADPDLYFERVVNMIKTFDPTANRPSNPAAYTNWLIRSYCHHGIVSWEDMSSTRDVLVQYDELKIKKVFKKMKAMDALNDATYQNYSDIMRIDGQTALSRTVRKTRQWMSGGMKEELRPEWDKYQAAAQRGGITIVWPHADPHDRDYGAAKDHSFVNFCKHGMVMVLNDVETSVELFKTPTPWCTARPGNKYFEDYTKDGPLYVLVDNKNDKLYQFAFERGSFLDEDNGHIDEPLAIPIPLLRAVVREQGTTMSEFLPKLDIESIPLANTLSKLTNDDYASLGDVLWKQYYTNPERFETSDAIFIVEQYVEQHDELPPLNQIETVLAKSYGELFNADDQPNDGMESIPTMAYFFAAMLRNTYAKPTPKLVNILYGYTENMLPIRARYFSDTHVWAQARHDIVEQMKTTQIGLGAFLMPDRALSVTTGRTSVPDRGDAPRSVIAKLKITEDEVDDIFRNCLQNPNTNITFFITSANTWNLLPSADLVREALTHRSPREQHRFHEKVYNAYIVDYLDLLDVDSLVRVFYDYQGADPNGDGPTTAAQIQRFFDISTVPNVRAKITASTFRIVMNGDSIRKYERIRGVYLDLLSDPEIQKVCSRWVLKELTEGSTSTPLSNNYTPFLWPELMKWWSKDDWIKITAQFAKPGSIKHYVKTVFEYVDQNGLSVPVAFIRELALDALLKVCILRRDAEKLGSMDIYWTMLDTIQAVDVVGGVPDKFFDAMAQNGFMLELYGLDQQGIRMPARVNRLIAAWEEQQDQEHLYVPKQDTIVDMRPGKTPTIIQTKPRGQ